jgi:hypothetical protein
MRLVSPASLQGAEKLVFDNLNPWLPTNGVCVNVMLGQDPWDIRPLLLINGKVSLYRFSRPLKQNALSALVAEMQGFAVIPGWEMKVEARHEAERLLLVRPVYPQTLEEELEKEGALTGQRRQDLVSSLIDVVKMLRKRSLVHGHISPSNIVEVNGAIVLLDPRLGALHYSKDEHLAPETNAGEEPRPEADLFGLGSVLSKVLGEDATHQQRETIDRLLLPSPRQRPTIEEVEREFIRALPPQTRASVRAGKVVKKPGIVVSSEAEPSKVTGARTIAPSEVTSRPWWMWLAGVVSALGVGIGFTRYALPSLYYDMARNVSFLAPPSNPELQLAWASNDKGRMRVVAQAAIEEHIPAAENAIIDDTLSGQNRPGVGSNLLRVALSDLWVDELSSSDRRAALALSVMPIYPEGLSALPPLNTLHPGVILAVAGQSQAKNASKQLSDISIDQLAALPAPVGPLFGQLRDGGSKTLGDPEVIALAGIVSGNPPADTLEAYIGAESPLPVALARIAIALPLLSANDASAALLLATLRDRGGEMGQTLSWFDIDGLGIWGKVKSADKLRIILGELPEQPLGVQHYSDLLTFPLADVRNKSAQVLKGKFLTGESDQLLLVLSGEQNRLSREQTIALLSALHLDVAKRAPYVEILFQLKPSPEMVLLVLLARSDKDSTDHFNLEAARYLRKNGEWTATTEMLQILARQPEPLARSLAYARLSTRDPAQKKILQQRLSEESDKALAHRIMEKLEFSVSAPPAGLGTPVPYTQPQPAKTP